MRTSALGDSGLVASALGLGLAAVGRPAYITLGRARDLPADRSPAAMRERTHRLLDAAAVAGVRYVDVARSYGRAEEFLAAWLAAALPLDPPVTVGSKWGYEYTGAWRLDAAVHERKEHTRARFARQLDESTRLLGDRLALYQVHSATLESGVLDDAGLLAALVAARRAGRCRAVGVTVTGPHAAATIERALEARADGERVFDVVQATFNVLERSVAPALARAHDAGLGVIAKEVVANGRLTPANDRPADAALVARLETIARRHGVPVDRVATAFALAQPFVDVTLSGAATTDQLASHVAAASLALSDADRRALAALAEPPERYWATRARLAWS
jgi:aryl-alcohol dehydrogenase-like predicted oxidoreductase